MLMHTVFFCAIRQKGRKVKFPPVCPVRKKGRKDFISGQFLLFILILHCWQLLLLQLLHSASFRQEMRSQLLLRRTLWSFCS